MRYGNLATLEDGYGINLLPLATFAMDTYANDPCTIFKPKTCENEASYSEKTMRLISQMHKAITIIQFKLEAGIINRHPEFGMDDRKLLQYIDFKRGVFVHDGKEYDMRDTNFPTVDPKEPYKLTDEEADLVNKLHDSFLKSEKLRKHMRCLFTYGGMYTVCNSNLMYHASIPMNEDGTFKVVEINGKPYSGRKLMDKIDILMRTAYFGENGKKDKQFALDYVWYLWCGPDSPLFDKSKMATFERYFLTDKETYKEVKGHYYTLRDSKEHCEHILEEFGVTGQHTHIINGHVPVKTIKGEKPIKADGKLLVIDGGFSKAYQPETGIAGYTLVYHSHGLQLVQHEPFQSRQKAIEEGLDIKSTTFIVEFNSQRMMVKDTDKGRELVDQIKELNKLLFAYRNGIIKERG
jgi:fructose-1,6-bisphosphatase-3